MRTVHAAGAQAVVRPARLDPLRCAVCGSEAAHWVHARVHVLALRLEVVLLVLVVTRQLAAPDDGGRL